MLIWNTIHIAGMILGFLGAMLLTFFGFSLRMRNGQLEVSPELAKVASKVQQPGLCMFAIGFILMFLYEMQSL